MRAADVDLIQDADRRKALISARCFSLIEAIMRISARQFALSVRSAETRVPSGVSTMCVRSL